MRMYQVRAAKWYVEKKGNYMRQDGYTLDCWTERDYKSLMSFLRRNAEEGYRQFSEKLIPESEPILGVKKPFLRMVGKQISQGNWREYLTFCRNDTFEEIVLQGIVIGLAPVNFDELCTLCDAYIPLIKNWAACDFFCCGLKRVKKFRKGFLPKIQAYLISENPWERRVALVLLRAHYMTEEYVEQLLVWAQESVCEHYYVQMAHAWLLAKCYTKYPEQTYQYLKDCCLGPEILNKAVQKIRDSYRVSEEWKEKATIFRRKL